MTPTIKDIAQVLGISHATVSRAINGRAGVSPELRQSILETAEKLCYTPNAIARGLVNRQSMTIAFIVPDFTNSFFIEIARAVNSTASARGFKTVMCDTQWSHQEELKQIRMMTENRVDGIIIKSFGEDDSYLVDLGVPVVKLNPTADPELSSIDVDNFAGAFAATEHLIQCGYEQIAYIGSLLDPQTLQGRIDGYRQALRAYNRAYEPRLVSLGEYTLESGSRCYEELRASGLAFDAVVCENDMIALGVYNSALQDKRVIPAQFGLIGFDDIFVAGLPMTQLTTMAQPKFQIGERAANLLIDLINDPGQTKNQSIILNPELVVRSTTRNICT